MNVVTEKRDLGAGVRVGDQLIAIPRGGSVELTSRGETQVVALVRTETGAALRELTLTERGDAFDVAQRDL